MYDYMYVCVQMKDLYMCISIYIEREKVCFVASAGTPAHACAMARSAGTPAHSRVMRTAALQTGKGISPDFPEEQTSGRYAPPCCSDGHVPLPRASSS